TQEANKNQQEHNTENKNRAIGIENQNPARAGFFLVFFLQSDFKAVAMGFQPEATLAVVGTERLHLLPEQSAVIVMHQMADLMRNEIVDYRFRSAHDLPVVLNDAAAGTVTPLCFCLSQHDALVRAADLRAEQVGFFAEQAHGLCLVPLPKTFANPFGQRAAPAGADLHAKVIALERSCVPLALGHQQGVRTTEELEDLALPILLFAHLPGFFPLPLQGIGNPLALALDEIEAFAVGDKLGQHQEDLAAANDDLQGAPPGRTLDGDIKTQAGGGGVVTHAKGNSFRAFRWHCAIGFLVGRFGFIQAFSRRPSSGRSAGERRLCGSCHWRSGSVSACSAVAVPRIFPPDAWRHPAVFQPLRIRPERGSPWLAAPAPPPPGGRWRAPCFRP